MGLYKAPRHFTKALQSPCREKALGSMYREGALYTHTYPHFGLFCYTCGGASQSPYRERALQSPCRQGAPQNPHKKDALQRH